ncbi:MAG: thioredoxin TrxC [Sulfurovaceae bacterium]|nr:thioredoxin TrxC [Sulfurovaceae bacterium]
MQNLKVVCQHCFKINSLPVKDSYQKANCGHCKKSLLDTKPVELTSKNFDYYIANNDLPILVDYWAPWCGPCRMMAPTFEQVASTLPLKVLFAKVNTENEQLLASRFGISGIPTLILFKNGKEANRTSGALDAGSLKRFALS